MTPDETKALIDAARGWDADTVHRHAMSALDTIHRLAHALSALSSHPDEETEWEWGASWLEGDERVFMPTENDWRAEVEVNRMNMGYEFPDENYVVRRRKAGPWLPVPADEAVT